MEPGKITESNIRISVSPALLIGILLFITFLCMYSTCRYDEKTGDGFYITCLLRCDLQEFGANGDTIRHYLPRLLMYYSNVVYGAFRTPNKDVSELLTIMLRSAIMNSYIGAALLVVIFSYTYIATKRWTVALLVSILVGFSTIYWMMSTSAEDVMLSCLFIFLALLTTMTPSGYDSFSLVARLILSALFSALTVISHLPTLVFIPVVLFTFLLFNWSKLENSTHKHQLSERVIGVISLGVLWLLCTELFIRVCSPYSCLDYLAFVLRIFSCEQIRATTPDQLYSVNKIINTFLAMVLTFTNWCQMTGIHTVHFERLYAHGELSVIGNVLAIIIISILTYSVFIGLRPLLSMRKLQIPSLEFYWLISSLWCLIGVITMFAGHMGRDAEFWTPVLIGTAPTLGFLLVKTNSRRLTVILFSIVIGLAITNFCQGVDQFWLEPCTKHRRFIQISRGSLDVQHQSRPCDVFLGARHYHQSSLILPAVTCRRRHVILLDHAEEAQIEKAVRKAIKADCRVFVFKQVWLCSDIYRAQLARMGLNCDDTADHVKWLKNHFTEGSTFNGSSAEWALVQLIPKKSFLDHESTDQKLTLY